MAKPLADHHGDPITATDLYVWQDGDHYWNEADGAWKTWPMEATVYAPQFPDGKRTCPTSRPHDAFTGGWRLLTDALRYVERRPTAYGR